MGIKVMLVAYFSVTGNVRNFVDRSGLKSVEITPSNPFIEVDEDYIIIAPTYEYDVTEPINEFIEYVNNQKYLKGVVGSGNYNFDDLYVFTAKDISKEYNIPLLLDFEYFGTDKDVENLKEVLNGITRVAK